MAHCWMLVDLIRGSRAGLMATLLRLLFTTMQRVFRQNEELCQEEMELKKVTGRDLVIGKMGMLFYSLSN